MRPEQNTELNAKTKQCITAKISGYALKQWSRTHSVLRQRSSQLQKHQATRMSRRIAIEQRKYAAGMAGTQGWQFETCWTTQELRMLIKYARKVSFFIMWLLYV